MTMQTRCQDTRRRDLIVARAGTGAVTDAGDITAILLNRTDMPGVFDGPVVTIPSVATPSAITSANLEHVATADILVVGTKSTEDNAPMRVTRSAPLLQRGDFNATSMVDGDDIQRFIEVYMNPGSANRKDYYATDMNGDGDITEDDLECLLLALHFSTRCESSPYCDGGGDSPMMGVGGDGGEEPETSGPPESDRQRVINEWNAMYPRSAYIAFTDGEYAAERIRYLVRHGVILGHPESLAASSH